MVKSINTFKKNDEWVIENKERIKIKQREYYKLHKKEHDLRNNRYHKFNKLMQELPFYRISISTSLY